MKVKAALSRIRDLVNRHRTCHEVGEAIAAGVVIVYLEEGRSLQEARDRLNPDLMTEEDWSNILDLVTAAMGPDVVYGAEHDLDTD